MIRRPPRSTQSRSSAASDVYKRQPFLLTSIKAEFRHGLSYIRGRPQPNTHQPGNSSELPCPLALPQDKLILRILKILHLHPSKTCFLQPLSTFFSSLQHVHRKHRCSFTPFPNKITHSHRPARRQYGMHPLEKFAVCIWPVDMTHVAQIGHAKRTHGQLLREVGGHACNHLRLLSQMLTRNRYYICTVHQCRIHPLIRKTKRHVPNGTTNIQHGLDRNRPSVVRHPVHHLLHHLGSALSHSEHKTAQIP